MKKLIPLFILIFCSSTLAQYKPVLAGLGPLVLPEAVAHTGVRAPFAFPDGTRSDLVLTPRGWHRRASSR